MKKTFKLNDTNHSPERKADKIKHEVKKYIARERRKSTPENVDFWDFNCVIGATAQEAKMIEVKDINSQVSTYVTEGKSEFYLEILAKPGHKPAKKED
jgi:hypothetical protein